MMRLSPALICRAGGCSQGLDWCSGAQALRTLPGGVRSLCTACFRSVGRTKKKGQTRPRSDRLIATLDAFGLAFGLREVVEQISQQTRANQVTEDTQVQKDREQEQFVERQMQRAASDE